jgi:hypothetical protein
MNSNDEEAAQPLTERAALHRVDLKVRLLPGHPRFWTCQFGILYVWLYADSAEGAEATAEKIIAALPYERVVGFLRISTRNPTSAPAEGEQLARESGLALQLRGVALGADEAEFETDP